MAETIPQTGPVVHAQMLIRRPAAEVYAAFVDPAVTTRFWFTRSSGPLREGAEVRWDWEMYGVHTSVRVKALEPGRRILAEWDEPPCPVEWRFEPRAGEATLVKIAAWGFRGTPEEVTTQAVDASGGFHLVLAGLKAWMEHGLALNLVADKNPAQ